LRRAAALALTLAGALCSYAQTPPDTAPPPAPPPGETAPAPAQAPAEQPANSPPEPLPARAAHAATVRVPPPQAQPPAPDREGEIAALKAEVSRLQSALDAERAATTLPPAEEAGTAAEAVRGAWEWLLIVALLGLTAGFVLGWRVLDRRIRRKYGGLRIY